MLTQRILLLVVLALAPALAIQGYNEYALRSARETFVRAEAVRGARAVAADIEQFAQGVRQVLSILAADPGIRRLDPVACTDTLRTSTALLPGTGMLGLIDANGDLVCNSTGLPPGSRSFSDRRYFKRVLRTGAFAVGNYVEGRISGNPTIQLAYPITAPTGEVTGVLFDSINLDWLAERIGNLGLGQDAAVTVADEDGVILVRIPDHAAWVGRRLSPERMAFRAASNGEAQDRVDISGRLRIVSIAKFDGPLSGLSVAVGQDRAAAFADVNAATWRGAILILTGALLAIASTLLFGRFLIRRPVGRLLASATAWQSGNLEARSGINDSSEFGKLGRAFDAMAAALQAHESQLHAEISRSRALQEQQTTMLHELNHRVKNTLATVQSLARQARGGEAQAAQLEARILALSKTHDLLTCADWTGASLREVLENELAPYRNGADHICLDGPDVALPPRYVLAIGMTMHELTTNAAKYGALATETGQIRVTWRIVQDETGARRLCLDWQESGGPAVTVPQRRGFGTRLIAGGIQRELGGTAELTFDPGGLRCCLVVPLQAQQPTMLSPLRSHAAH